MTEQGGSLQRPVISGGCLERGMRHKVAGGYVDVDGQTNALFFQIIGDKARREERKDEK